MSFLPRLFSSVVAGPSRLSAYTMTQSPVLHLNTRTFSTSPIIEGKMRTNKSAAARFKKTGSGKWKRWRAGQNHGHTDWTGDRLNRLGRSVTVKSKRLARTLRRLMPYA